MHYEVIIIGSGAGECAAAYHLTQTGKRVLLLEKGMPLPKDGSTLDVEKVMKRGLFLNQEPWVDRSGRVTAPEEHFNLGGKTKWYGAALLRFSPREFLADEARACLPWPIRYEELEPFYAEAERLLAVRFFAPEANFQQIAAGLSRIDPGWRSERLAVGLAPEILEDAQEARHFDGFASVRGLKFHGESALLERVRGKPNLQVVTGKAVTRLLPAPEMPLRVSGVECADGSRYEADAVLLAAGALHSPRLLQIYLEQNELAQKLPAYRNVGRNYKFHVLTAMLAFSHRPVTDTLCKTMLLLNDAFPSSSVQTLGGNLAYEIVMTQFPQRVPGGFSMRFARRAYGFFLQTEDGSHPDNRIVAAANGSDYPGSITILTALPLRWPSTAGSLEPCNGNCCDSATLLSPSRFQSPARHTLAGPW
jgi:choline dehydrogenase-like flavoprotein